MMQKYEITSQSVSTCIMILLHVFFLRAMIYTIQGDLHLGESTFK